MAVVSLSFRKGSLPAGGSSAGRGDRSHIGLHYWTDQRALLRESSVQDDPS